MPPLFSLVMWNTLVASALVVLMGLAGHGGWLRRRPAVMHLLWLLVLARFVIPGWIPLPVLPPPATLSADAVSELAAGSPDPSAENVEVRNATDATTAFPTTVETVPGATKGQGPPSVRPGRSFLAAAANLDWLFVGLSCFVSIGLTLWSVVRSVRFHRWLKTVSAPEERLERLADVGCRQMGLAERPEVRRLATGGVPFLWGGGRRPCVYIPSAILDSFDDEALTGVLCHEMAHHARGDVWPRLFASAVAVVGWWNPLVWWARRQLSNCQELCCDAMVVSAGRSRRAYAESLLRTLDLATGAIRLPGLLASGWGEGGPQALQNRFRLLGDVAVTSHLPMGAPYAAVGLGTILLCVPVRGDAEREKEIRPALILKEPFIKPAGTANATPEQQVVKIVGRVIDPAGRPLKGMQIVAAVLPGPPKRAPKPGRAMEWKPEGEPSPWATTDAEGRFTIDAADSGATILVQFEGYERLPSREWKPKGSVGTTIMLAPDKKERDNEIGHVPRTITTKETTVDGKTIREVAITWAPTRVIVRWGRAATIDRWKESRALAEANDPRWKEALGPFDETTWIVQPGEYMRREATVRIDMGPALKADTSFGEGLRVGSEKEIILFFGGAVTPTKDVGLP